ncbi:SLC13 family permease [Nitrincola tapanii]|uniref:SLC13 family permease n=1 Tax=Nitrincola tapanii TaxID=1708751 RepID=A0A5A9W1M9_9GAMM|nr:SLC13 family permease [Nitrincola tapanii]KAA0874384.1 SLC13 family permease [Nitrincola tapanii]
MTQEAWIAIVTTLSVLGLLAATRISADLILMAALTVLLITGTLTPTDALSGFSNSGVLTIAALLIVSAGLKQTGSVQFITTFILGRSNHIPNARMRLVASASLLSAFMNNTAVVAMLIPTVQDWCQRMKIPVSQLLLPLSYAAILGGTVTLIGTSTNLVVYGLLLENGEVSLNIFDLAWVGIPVLILGGGFMLLFSNKLLPLRQGMVDRIDQVREYEVEVLIDANSPLIGKTIAEAGLRNLQYTYLADIERHGRILTAVSPDTELFAQDRLHFIGAPEGAKELRAIKGLQPAERDILKLNLAHHQRCLVEAIVGYDFPSLGKTIKASRFRTRYKAVILSVSREGNRLPGKLGNITLQVGDTLLLETSQSFIEHYQFRKDFLLVSAINDSTPPDFQKAPRAICILTMMVLASVSGLLSIMESAFLAAGTMIALKCMTASHARRALDLQVLVVIAASFALGKAMQTTGAAAILVETLLNRPEEMMAPWIALGIIYLLTSIFTELITNNAAAVLMFPIAQAVASQLGVDLLPFAITIMFAASASFVTPLGYQTNMMVYGPGGYRFTDYLRLGLPVNFITAITAIALIPLIWGF